MKKILLSIFVAAVCLLGFTVTPAQATLGEYYNSHGMLLPSIFERAVIAAENGIFFYKGTATQNIQLEKIMRELEQQVGFSVVSRYRTTLLTSMTSVQSTVPVSSIQTFDGTTLTMALLGSKVFLVVEPGTSREEIVLCTNIQNSIFDPCTRGLAFSGTSTASVANNRKVHNAGSTVVMSNVHYVYEELLDKDTDQSVSSTITFTALPLVPTSTPTDDRQVVSFYQFQQATTTGGVNGTTTAKGVYEAATDAELKQGTVFGTTGAPLAAMSQSHTQTSTANKVPVGNGSGKLQQGWFDLTQGFTFSGGVTSSAPLVVSATSTFATSSITTATITSSTITTGNLSTLNVSNTSTINNIAVNGNTDFIQWKFVSSSTSLVAPTPASAKVAIVSVQGTQSICGLPSAAELTIFPANKTVGTFYDDCGAHYILITATWSGNTVTIAYITDSGTVSATSSVMYFYK